MKFSAELEAVARALCLADGRAPDMRVPNPPPGEWPGARHPKEKAWIVYYAEPAKAALKALAAAQRPYAWIQSWVRDGETDDPAAHKVFYEMTDELKQSMEQAGRYRVTPVYAAIRAQGE